MNSTPPSNPEKIRWPYAAAHIEGYYGTSSPNERHLEMYTYTSGGRPGYIWLKSKDTADDPDTWSIVEAGPDGTYTGVYEDESMNTVVAEILVTDVGDVVITLGD